MRFLVLFLILQQVLAANSQTLSNEMGKLGVNTMVLFRAAAIEGYPVWNDKSDTIGCNLQGTWFRFGLDGLKLKSDTFHGKPVAIPVDLAEGILMSEAEVMQYSNNSFAGPLVTITDSGTKLEFKKKGKGMLFQITPEGGKASTAWLSKNEQCSNLTLSPDQNWVAYICEFSGLIIMKLEN